MHNAEKPNPPASVRDTGGQGEFSASSNTRARNSLRAVATHNAPSPGVHGEGIERYAFSGTICRPARPIARQFGPPDPESTALACVPACGIGCLPMSRPRPHGIGFVLHNEGRIRGTLVP